MHFKDCTPQTGHDSLQCTVLRQKKKTAKGKTKNQVTRHTTYYIYIQAWFRRLRITTPEND